MVLPLPGVRDKVFKGKERCDSRKSGGGEKRPSFFPFCRILSDEKKGGLLARLEMQSFPPLLLLFRDMPASTPGLSPPLSAKEPLSASAASSVSLFCKTLFSLIKSVKRRGAVGGGEDRVSLLDASVPACSAFFYPMHESRTV